MLLMLAFFTQANKPAPRAWLPFEQSGGASASSTSQTEPQSMVARITATIRPIRDEVVMILISGAATMTKIKTVRPATMPEMRNRPLPLPHHNSER